MARYYRNNVLGVSDNNDSLPVTSCSACNNVAGVNTCSCNRNECMMDILCNYIGCNCNCSFDTQSSRGLEEVAGILEDVGDNYITIRSTNTGRRTICNTNTLQFVNIL